MGVAERKARAKENLRQEILDAARDLFAKHGYDAVSMRKIAEKIEYSQTTIYLYFESKDEILDCLCEETFAKLIKKLELIEKDDSADPLDVLRRGIRAYIDFGLKNPNHYIVTCMTPRHHLGDNPQCSRKFQMGMRAFDHKRRMVARCMAAGRIPQGDVEEISQALLTTSHGVVSFLIANEGFPLIDKNTLIERSIRIMIEGIKAG